MTRRLQCGHCAAAAPKTIERSPESSARQSTCFRASSKRSSAIARYASARTSGNSWRLVAERDVGVGEDLAKEFVARDVLEAGGFNSSSINFIKALSISGKKNSNNTHDSTNHDAELLSIHISTAN